MSLYLRQPFADHICSALIMTEAEEAEGDGFRQEFIPLPASCLQIAFLHPSWRLPLQTSPFIIQLITISHYFMCVPRLL